MTEPTEPTETTPAGAAQIAAMQALRAALLAQHKVLIANDRQQYEAVFGPVPTGRFVQLLTEDPWFRWLDPLSRLIVAIDEWFEQTPPTEAGGIALADMAATLFRHTDAEFGERYRLALQQAPDIVLGQSRVLAVLRDVPQSAASPSASVEQEPDASANEEGGA
ncbi:hypothetical protein HUS70_07865 [Pandoraea nosoerga]|uniref:Uncharacterized protein n=1 Tax=Pandoraea nosoerga TaxID=2508296 RepID=A0A5E4XTA5_9BURK|nr:MULTISPECIES: hypothetical protein [Pandoraea]MBN4667544.1 hypothetical protein [Pandoraea nosoerga]MBN4674874.1 hypothetical protein [Pandoraea nosoerga]MBN4680190.1 hypothetical protein [Pandoraea nosoerga]MBN4744576.1 hypothetical protein [Pandoraea nosoerga]VVE39691.1 hypothetical protein PNO31109_04085 [Pandoraea nosoerga]